MCLCLCVNCTSIQFNSVSTNKSAHRVKKVLGVTTQIKHLFREWLTLIKPYYNVVFWGLIIEIWCQDTWLVYTATLGLKMSIMCLLWVNLLNPCQLSTLIFPVLICPLCAHHNPDKKKYIISVPSCVLTFLDFSHFLICKDFKWLITEITI